MNRRKFLGTSILASGAYLQTPAAERETCGLAIGTYGLQSTPLSQALRVVSECGYDAVEITSFSGTTGDPSGPLRSKESRREIQKILEGEGLRLTALMVDLKPEMDESKPYGRLPKLNQLIQLARDLSPESPPLLQTILGGKEWEESKTRFRDRLANWNQILADQKGYLSIKPHRSHAMSLPSEAVWLLQQLGNPRRLGMVYDYSHYAFRDPAMAIEETVRESLPVTNYVAVKDAVPIDGNVRFALAGESGSWDHADIFRAFYEGGYRGDFCCEVSSQIWRNNPDYDAVAATKTCFSNMVKAFEEAGVPRG